MTSRLAFKCDDCGDEIAIRSNPVIYLVVGTTDEGKMDADVKLPPQAWEVLKCVRGRLEYCAGCFAKRFGTPLVTVDEYEASLKSNV